MKSDIDIKDDLYSHIRGSSLESMVTGVLSKTKRPAMSDAEDIVISVLTNGPTQIQEAFVTVDIYVSDLLHGTQYVEDTIRLRQLCQESAKLLEVGRGKNYRFALEEQRVMEVNGKNEHFIYNKILYKYSNE